MADPDRLDRWEKRAAVFCIFGFALTVAGSLISGLAGGIAGKFAVRVQEVFSVAFVVGLVALLCMFGIEKRVRRRKS